MGHVNVGYEKILKRGFRGIIEDSIKAMNDLDPNDPESIQKTQFYKAVIISYTAKNKFCAQICRKSKGDGIC